MNRARISTTGVLLAFLLVACGSSDNPTEPEGPSSSGSGASGSTGSGTTGSAGESSTSGGITGTGGQAASGSTGSDGATGSGGAGAADSTGGDGAGGDPTGDGGAGGSPPDDPPVIEPTLITSGPNDYWKIGMPTEVTTGNADVTVNDATTHQRWDGFGGTFNEAGWHVLSMLSESERARAIKLLFHKHEGAAFVYGRVPVGASDYAMDRYTHNETRNDYDMKSFSIERDKEKLIPYIKAALAVNPNIHLWASPWTPPTWMKSNGAMDGGNMKDDANILRAYALYLAKFVEAYRDEGLTIEAIHPQNEPNYETRYPSCIWTGPLMAKFIGTYLGPTFADRGLTTEIYLGTMSNNESGKDGAIISAVTGDATAMKYVKGFGLQWNMLSSVNGLRSRNLPIVQTEHKCGNYHWNPPGFPKFNPDKPPNDHAYAEESWGLIRDWIQAGVTSYSAWNMVLDTAGKNLDTQRPWPQNALLVVDTAAKTLIVTPAYHVFRHVSEYVDPGATRVGTTGGDALAFKNPDGTIVTILYNSGNSDKTTTLSVAGKKLQFSVPAHGWATVNWK